MEDPGKENRITVGPQHGKVWEPLPKLIQMLQKIGGYCCLLDQFQMTALLATPESSCIEYYLLSCAKI